MLDLEPGEAAPVDLPPGSRRRRGVAVAEDPLLAPLDRAGERHLRRVNVTLGDREA
jgi:hypothetical protein